MVKSKKIKVVIIGAGGSGREALWSISDCNKISKQFDVLGFIDDNPQLKGKKFNKIPVLGNLDWLVSELDDVGCIIAIGDCKIRKKLTNMLSKKNFEFPNLIHPTALCSESAEIGHGVVIQAGSIISVDVKIGNHSYVNYGSTIGHDCRLGEYVTLSPGVHLSGSNFIDEGVYIGTGTVTKQNITIGKWSFIGGGTVVGKSIPDFSMYFGMAGRVKKFVS